MLDKIERDPDVIWRKIDDNVVILSHYSTEPALITLNSTAAYIWELCDGTMNARDIAMMMQEQFTASYEEIYDDVVTVLNRLADKGFLKNV
jgi:hypothetical protein